ncbi:UNVERIFIED_CONTAM: hypothetical protein Sradi_6826000 [Sesamum radiatum]|uniref:Uncharacterized protein n=1 Tax=Sesamum radiatum TaxID=300843 RepID=A0AAW2JT09_SESRA
MDVCHESNFAAISALQLHIPSSQQTLPSLPVAPFPELESILSPPKIHLQLFDGENPLDRIFHAEQFFEYYAVPLDSRLHHISCYMTGDALG